MPRKTSLKTAIAKAAEAFAMQVVKAIKGASLAELIALQGGAPKRHGRKPGPKPKARKKPGPKPKAKRKPGRPKKKVAKKPGRKPGRPKKTAGRRKITITKRVTPKKRVAKNYPKCAYPKCNKNRFPRGKGFCGDHWKQWKAGKIKAASAYKK